MILEESNKLIAPQDLRNAVFCISSIQNSSHCLQMDILTSEKRNPMKLLDLNHVQISFRFGATAVVAVHICYPNIPGGVHIESITRHRACKYTEEELRDLVSTVNHQSIFTLVELIDLLD